MREQTMMTWPQPLTVFSLGGSAGPGGLAVQLAASMVLVVPVVLAYMPLLPTFVESMAGAGGKG